MDRKALEERLEKAQTERQERQGGIIATALERIDDTVDALIEALQFTREPIQEKQILETLERLRLDRANITVTFGAGLFAYREKMNRRNSR